jgi:chromosome segregation ATPase
LLLEISDLRKELTQKERVCEVKIERVVDGKERIGELERAVFELELQLKQLSQEKEELGEEVRRRQNTVDELNGRIFKLEAEVKTLKAYIEKREGGFKWTVEREIEKDMVISQQKPEAYKVYQVREYSRETALDNRTHVAESIANSLQQTFFNNQTEQIVITEQRLFN